MKKDARRLPFFSLFLLVAACSGEGPASVGQTSEPIAGGADDDNGYPAVGFVMTAGTGSNVYDGALCSGALANVPGMPAALVGRVVITAAHCVQAARGAALADHRPIQMGFGVGARQSAAAVVPALAVIDHPIYQRMVDVHRGDYGDISYDVAVMILARKIDGVQPLTVQPYDDSLADRLLALGYGQNHHTAGGIRRHATRRLDFVGHSDADLPTKNDDGSADFLRTRARIGAADTGAVCAGDSGSPLIVEGTGVMVGAAGTHGGEDGCDLPEPEASRRARGGDGFADYVSLGQHIDWMANVLTACNQGSRYYPEVAQYTCGALIDGWDRNGGLPVLGFPTGSMYWQTNRDGSGRRYLYQWFQRNRLEYQPQNGAPYDFQFGLLGQEIHGLDFETFSGPRYGCEFISPDGGNQGRYVCGNFLEYWRSHGGMRILGAPISPSARFVDPAHGFDGEAMWFQRTRLENHGGLVLGGLLGCEASGFRTGCGG